METVFTEMKTTKSASFAVKHLKTNKENKTKLVMLGSIKKSSHLSNALVG